MTRLVALLLALVLFVPVAFATDDDPPSDPAGDTDVTDTDADSEMDSGADTDETEPERPPPPPPPPPPELPTHVLKVGTKDAPPFAMKDETGKWSGLTIELWDHVATDLGIRYEWEERDLKGLLDGVQDGSLDAVAAALTITGERERRFDFSHPFFASGLGIAVGGTAGPLDQLAPFFSPGFLRVVTGLFITLLIVGALVWFFERRRNEEFGGSVLHGMGAGLWWSAVTMTTVGYGDKSPRTFFGRLIGLVWMFASIIVISSFTAAIASSLTVGSLSTAIDGPEDLGSATVGTVEASTSAQWLIENRITHKGYPSVADAMNDLAVGKLDAVVYDRPMLQYLAHKYHDGEVTVLPNELDQGYYGIGLPLGSSLREPLNQALLERTDSEWWLEQKFRYLGH